MTSLPGSQTGEMKLVEGLSVFCNGEIGNRQTRVLLLICYLFNILVIGRVLSLVFGCGTCCFFHCVRWNF